MTPSGSAVAKDAGNNDITPWAFGGCVFSIAGAGHTTSPARTPAIVYDEVASGVYSSALKLSMMADDTWTVDAHFALPATFTRWRSAGVTLETRVSDWAGGTATDAVGLKLEVFNPATGASLASTTRTATNDGSNPYSEAAAYSVIQVARSSLELADWAPWRVVRIRITATPDAGNASEALDVRLGRLRLAWGD